LLFLGAAFMAGNALKEMDWSTEFTKEDLHDLDTYYVFGQWHKKFERNYPTQAEEAHRYSIWMDNIWKISDHNSLGLTYKLRLNQFGDLTEEEFRYQVNGKNGTCLPPIPQHKSKKPSKHSPNKEPVTLPASVDWQAKGVVTPVKNQGQCGSCWAYSATGSMECNYAIKTGQLNSLSEQQLVDCTWSYGNQGCAGGWYYGAWDYAVKEGGLCSESEYPYEAKDEVCRAHQCSAKYNPISSYSEVNPDDESALQTASVSGCVSVAIQANQMAFQFYSSGVLTGRCGTRIDHAVLVVGYGTDNGQDYWKVKNSWGTQWGDQGYVYVCRSCNENGNRGECGINMYPAFAVI